MVFGFGEKAAPVPSGPSKLTMAKVETKMYSDMFNRMTDICFQKCQMKYNEPDLNVGEMSCIDRCVGKYMEGHMKISEVMAKAQMEMQGANNNQ